MDTDHTIMNTMHIISLSDMISMLEIMDTTVMTMAIMMHTALITLAFVETIMMETIVIIMEVITMIIMKAIMATITKIIMEIITRTITTTPTTMTTLTLCMMNMEYMDHMDTPTVKFQPIIKLRQSKEPSKKVLMFLISESKIKTCGTQMSTFLITHMHTTHTGMMRRLIIMEDPLLKTLPQSIEPQVKNKWQMAISMLKSTTDCKLNRITMNLKIGHHMELPQLMLSGHISHTIIMKVSYSDCLNIIFIISIHI